MTDLAPKPGNPADAPALRTSPRQIAVETRALRLPGLRPFMVALGLTAVVLGILLLTVGTLDAALFDLVTGTSLVIPPAVRTVLQVVWFGAAGYLALLSRLHKGPGGDLTGAFSATAETEWGGMTPTERRVNARTIILIAVIMVLGMVLTLSA